MVRRVLNPGGTPVTIFLLANLCLGLQPILGWATLVLPSFHKQLISAFSYPHSFLVVHGSFLPRPVCKWQLVPGHTRITAERRGGAVPASSSRFLILNQLLGCLFRIRNEMKDSW